MLELVAVIVHQSVLLLSVSSGSLVGSELLFDQMVALFLARLSVGIIVGVLVHSYQSFRNLIVSPAKFLTVKAVNYKFGRPYLECMIERA